MQGDFSQRINSISKDIAKIKKKVNKNTKYLTKKLWQENLDKKHSDLYSKQEQIEKYLDNVNTIINEFDEIYKDI